MLRRILLRFPGQLEDELLMAVVRTFVARVVAAMGAIVLLALLGRLYGPEGVGVFAVAQSLYFGASILARGGMDNALMRYVGQNPNSVAIGTYLRWALRGTAVKATIAAALIFILRARFAVWFDTPILSSMLPGISIVVPPLTMALILSGFMRGIRKPAVACLLENGSISLVACLVLVCLYPAWPLELHISAWAIAIAACIVFALGLWETWRWFDKQNLTAKTTQVKKTEFDSSSRAFYAMNFAQFLQQTVCVLIAARLLDSAELGLFRSAERITLLLSFMLFVINSIVPPRFATLYENGKITELAALIRRAHRLALLFSAPFLFVCLFMPKAVLAIFGQGFTEASIHLQILAIARVICVATGSVGFLLTMTGYEKLVRNILLITHGLGVVMFFIFVPIWGALGATIALSLVLVPQNLICAYYVWRKLGIWPLPLGGLDRPFSASAKLKAIK